MTAFLGFPFTPIEIGQRAIVTDFLARHPQPLSDYSSASLCVWSSVFRYQFAVAEPDTLLLHAQLDPDPQPRLLQPLGQFSEALQETLLAHARELPAPLVIESVSAEFLARHPAFAAHFHVVANRDSANYVYQTEDLAALAGHRYAKKRNLIQQATRLYDWRIEPLGPQHSKECLEVGDDIAAKRTTLTLQQESRALATAIRDFGALGLAGLLLRIDDRPAAFSIYDRLNPTTALVLFERALRDKKGLYQAINQETARAIAAQGLRFINREEDLGDPGLRRAKLSYHPVRLEAKHTLTLRR
ncbi:MAG TPA: phosphatidylglycerol lysyltransferase domain-containing protein [Polyangia bacterium]|nr:phosphatidylglycerol lysyltransferase domain-containing protein [Polyangia bacterium]